MPVFVNKLEISDDEVHNEMRHHPAPSVDEARKQASRALIIRRLLLEAACQKDLVTYGKLTMLDKAREESVIEQLIEDVISVPTADDATCKRYYEQHLDRFADKRTGETLPFNLVRNHIKVYLEDKGHMSALNAYIDDLMDKANIVGLV